MTPDLLARAERVTRTYGDVVALDDVTVDIPRGGVTGLLGPNGAGKTTLIALLIGLRRPTRGRVELFGGDPTQPARRTRLGVTAQESGTPPSLRVGEIVDFVAAHFPDPIPTAEVLERFDLVGQARRQTGALSGGQKRRLAVALAFVGRPELVILDEPTTGLDVESRHALWQAIRDAAAAGMTVLLSSHYLEEVERLAGRVVVLGDGRIVADDTVAAVRRMVGLKQVALTAPAAPHLEPIVRTERVGDRWTLWTPDADAVVRELVRSGTAFTDLEVRPASLEDAFLALTGSAPATRTVEEVSS